MGDDGGYRRTDRSTSKDAAKSISATETETYVYEALKKFGDYGANWWELEQSGDMLRQTISPRFAPLCRKGYIKEKIDGNGNIVKRPGKSNRKQTVWIAVERRRTVDLAERILQVRMAEAKIEEEEKALAEKHKRLKAWTIAARAEILAYLNETGQKSAATPNGTAYWKEKVTYRVTDKDEFRRHVIGTESWELLSWAAAPAQVEELVQAEQVVPPGLFRNAVNILYVNPPPKPRKKVTGKDEEIEEDEEIKQAAE